MRLFIAINFSKEIKDILSLTIARLKDQSPKGSFTLRENLHLTLVFLGEVDPAKVALITKAMLELRADTFELSLQGLGNFRRNEGDIYWIGIEKNAMIDEIYLQLFRNLSQVGFELENRPFKPHLTIGRRVIINPDFDKREFDRSTPVMKMNIDRISLMKSERINGKLTYTEIFTRELQRQEKY